MDRRPTIAVPCLTLAALAAVPATKPSAPDPETAQYWAGRLATLNRQLSARGPTTGPDRAALWLAKAEALVQTGQLIPAAAAFDHAAAEPGVGADVADHAAAMALLVHKSDFHGYHAPATRQDPTPPAFDLRDVTAREAALAALWTNESAALAARVDKAKAATDQATVVGLLKTAAVLRPVEQVVTQGTDKTDAAAQSVATHFTDAVVAWAADTADRMAQLKSMAEEAVVETPMKGNHMLNGGFDEGWRFRGVQQQDKAEANAAIAECRRLAGLYRTLQPLASETARKTLEPIKAHVQVAYDNASDLFTEATRPTRDNVNNPPN